MKKHGLEKRKTIEGSYRVVGGVSKPQPQHALQTTGLAYVHISQSTNKTI